jgi:hypothetical protein
MGRNRFPAFPRGRAGVPSLLACLCAGALLLAAANAVAQGTARPDPQSEDIGFFDRIGRWFDEQTARFNSNLKNAGTEVDNFGREAGIAAKTTVDAAKGAADAVVRIPNARVITGHEKCVVAPNGAPDCVAAAVNFCKAKGFQSGKSMDMTTAEVCPPQVLLSGRSSGPECHDETFVSRILCQ